MNKEQLIEKIKSPEALAFAKLRIADINTLPKKGIVAGQAVTSAVIEFLKMDKQINPIYNDVDVFKLISEDRYSKYIRTSDTLKALRKRDLSTASMLEGSIEVVGYGQVFEIIQERQRVLGSFTKDKLNSTYIRTEYLSRYHEFNILKVIKAFDINSTKIGFDIRKSTELTFTNSFVDFLINKELVIDNWNSPIHTLVRSVKKQQEYGENTFFDFEENKMIALAYKNIIENVKKTTEKLKNNEIKLDDGYSHEALKYLETTPLSFGTKYNEEFNHFGMDKMGLELINRPDTDYHTISSLDGLENDKFLNSIMNFNQGLINEPLLHGRASESLFGIKESMSSVPKHKDLSYLTFTTFAPEIYKSLKNTKKTTRLYVQHEFDTLSYIPAATIINLKDTNPQKIVEYRAAVKFLRFKHDLSFLMNQGFTPDEMILATNNIKAVDKESNIFIGSLEGKKKYHMDHSYLLDIDKSREEVKRYLTHIKKKLKKRGYEFETENYYVRELITTEELIMEGRKLNHCVGGYGQQVKHGTSTIISYSHKTDKDKHFTIDLNPYEQSNLTTKKFKIVQAYGYKNEKIYLSEEIYKTFKKLNVPYLKESELTVFKKVFDTKLFTRLDTFNWYGKLLSKIVNSRKMINLVQNFESVIKMARMQKNMSQMPPTHPPQNVDNIIIPEINPDEIPF